MFIVKRGKLIVVSEDGSEIFATLSKGAVFGELCILNLAGIRKILFNQENKFEFFWKIFPFFSIFLTKTILN